MVKKVIERSADGAIVSCITDGWPLTFSVKNENGDRLRIFKREQAEGLYYALGKVLDEAPTS